MDILPISLYLFLGGLKIASWCWGEVTFTFGCSQARTW